MGRALGTGIASPAAVTTTSAAGKTRRFHPKDPVRGVLRRWSLVSFIGSLLSRVVGPAPMLGGVVRANHEPESETRVPAQ
jgi:hypothetical protein